MSLKHPRALTGAGLLLLMFALGITLVTLLKSQPPPPQARPVPPRPTAPETPSEVVATYWRLALEGDTAGANKYWYVDVGKGELIHLEAVREDWNWAVAISLRKFRLTGIDREVAEADGSVTVITKATPDGTAPLTLYFRNTLMKVDSKWKIVDIDLTSPASIR